MEALSPAQDSVQKRDTSSPTPQGLDLAQEFADNIVNLTRDENYVASSVLSSSVAPALSIAGDSAYNNTNISSPNPNLNANNATQTSEKKSRFKVTSISQTPETSSQVSTSPLVSHSTSATTSASVSPPLNTPNPNPTNASNSNSNSITANLISNPNNVQLMHIQQNSPNAKDDLDSATKASQSKANNTIPTPNPNQAKPPKKSKFVLRTVDDDDEGGNLSNHDSSALASISLEENPSITNISTGNPSTAIVNSNIIASSSSNNTSSSATSNNTSYNSSQVNSNSSNILSPFDVSGTVAGANVADLSSGGVVSDGKRIVSSSAPYSSSVNNNNINSNINSNSNSNGVNNSSVTSLNSSYLNDSNISVLHKALQSNTLILQKLVEVMRPQLTPSALNNINSLASTSLTAITGVSGALLEGMQSSCPDCGSLDVRKFSPNDATTASPAISAAANATSSKANVNMNNFNTSANVINNPNNNTKLLTHLSEMKKEVEFLYKQKKELVLENQILRNKLIRSEEEMIYERNRANKNEEKLAIMRAKLQQYEEEKVQKDSTVLSENNSSGSNNSNNGSSTNNATSSAAGSELVNTAPSDGDQVLASHGESSNDNSGRQAASLAATHSSSGLTAVNPTGSASTNLMNVNIALNNEFEV